MVKQGEGLTGGGREMGGGVVEGRDPETAVPEKQRRGGDLGVYPRGPGNTEGEGCRADRCSEPLLAGREQGRQVAEATASSNPPAAASPRTMQWVAR